MRLILIVFLYLNSFSVAAQSLQIKGTIKDEFGNPITAATLLLAKKKNVVIRSNKLGNFLLSTINGDSITCSHINYITQIEKIENNKTINFILIRATPSLHSLNISIFKKNKPQTCNELQETVGLKKDDEDDGDYGAKIEIPASYPGGDEKMKSYFKDSIQNNDSIVLKNVTGGIKLRLTIGKDGHVSNVYLLKGIEDFLDDYLIQIAHKMLWMPAQQNGRNIETDQDIEILLN